MTRGVIFFAFNSDTCDYWRIAVAAAKRINHFLSLPVTVITDEATYAQDTSGYSFDNVVVVDSDKRNMLDSHMWINTGRYAAYTLSPYDETLLLDVDYVVCTNELLSLFDKHPEFACYQNHGFMMYENLQHSKISEQSFHLCWATVVMFKRSLRVQQIFECMEMVQHNYSHYGDLHFFASMYRNDYALTFALRMANGHTMLTSDLIQGRLNHVSKEVNVVASNDSELCTEFLLITTTTLRNRTRQEYIKIKDMDFHMLQKTNVSEILK